MCPTIILDYAKARDFVRDTYASSFRCIRFYTIVKHIKQRLFRALMRLINLKNGCFHLSLRRKINFNFCKSEPRGIIFRNSTSTRNIYIFVSYICVRRVYSSICELKCGIILFKKDNPKLYKKLSKYIWFLQKL